MRDLWRLLADRRDYRLLVSAGLVSALGDYVLTVGLVYLVYDLTGSTLATSAVLVVSVLPHVLLASPVGVLVDRWDRRRTLAMAYVAHAVALLPLLAVRGGSLLWLVLAVTAGQAVLEQLSVPAEQALVPHLVPADRLLTANALNQQARNAARLVGSGMGGVAAAWGGLAAVAILDVVSFVAAAALVAAIRFRVPAAADHGADSGNDPRVGPAWWHEWRSGLRIARGSRTLRVVLVFTAVTSVGEGIMATLFAPFVRDVLHTGPEGYGLVVGIQAVGGVLGGLLVAATASRWTAQAMLGWGAVAFGVVDLALFLYPLLLVHLAPAVLLMVVVGVPGAAVSAGHTTLAQQATHDSYRGRVLGTAMALQASGLLLGAVLAGLLGEVVGIVPVIAWQGVGYLVLGVLVLLTLARDGVPEVAGTPDSASRQA